MTRLNVTGWQLTALTDVPEAARGPLPATVPGCVHTDLLAAGVIDDPYVGQNELSAPWIGRADWQYRGTFTVTAEMLTAEHLTLVCDGLDTVAEVSVNGELVARTESMHVGYRFELKDRVHGGENELIIVFRSPYAYAEAKQKELGDLPNAYPEPFNFIRKMACNFGWDWGPTLVTAGVWRDLYLESWSGTRLAGVRPLVTDATPEWAKVEVYAGLEGRLGGTLHAALTDPNGTVVAETETVVTGPDAHLTLNVTNPQRWWPRGHGEQPLYTLTLTLSESRWEGRIGLRTATLDTTPDATPDGEGAAFTLQINGKPVFCKGANWIPDDAFPHRVTPERYRERITQAADANMNMLRIWGGGIYESEAFYGVCDELGVMVWQDFLFACAAYPEEAPFTGLVEAEARYNVTRLAPHPSLVLWNGNNENLWGHTDWGWQEKLGDRTWGRGFYLGLLPRVVAELDSSRPYWPGSPYSGEGRHPNAGTHGPKHVWDVWNERDYKHYRDYRPRFAAEFGFQAPPTYAALARSVPEGERYATSPTMLHHQKAIDGNGKLMRGLEPYFGSDVTGDSDDFDDWLYLTQLNQARAVALGVEWYRSLYPHCAGTLYWQLNDLWPVTSWAAVDGDGHEKPLWYATKRFYAPQLLTFRPGESGPELVFCNDSDTSWVGEVSVRRLDFSGEVLAEETTSFYLHPRATANVFRVPAPLSVPGRREHEVLVAQTGDFRAFWYFLPDKELAYPDPVVNGQLDGDRLTLTAETFVRDLTVFPDRLNPDATVSDQLLTLLPGESVTLTLGGLEGADVNDLLKPPVMNCANRFGRR